jgi:hypothetical protein
MMHFSLVSARPFVVIGGSQRVIRQGEGVKDAGIVAGRLNSSRPSLGKPPEPDSTHEFF